MRATTEPVEYVTSRYDTYRFLMQRISHRNHTVFRLARYVSCVDIGGIRGVASVVLALGISVPVEFVGKEAARR